MAVDMSRKGESPVIVAAWRTAIGRAGGLFRSRTVEQLAAPVIAQLLADAELAANEVDEVWLGNALEGGNVARRAALAGGLPPYVPAFTVDRQCAGGLDTILTGVQRVAAGEAAVILAGGVESCSTAPWRLNRPLTPAGLPEVAHRAPQSAPPYADPDPVAMADQLSGWAGIGRSAQDSWAARSHAHAIAAMQSGAFDAERVGVFDAAAPESDEAPKAGLTTARFGRLKPLGGGEKATATPGTTAPEADAAAAVLVMTAAMADRLGLPHRMRLTGSAQAGCDPAWAGYAAVPAVQRLQQRGGNVALHRLEFNEAFAGQTLACLQGAGLPQDRVSLNGGALAFGHPYGASGALLALRLFHDLAVGETGLAAVSAMGGQGTAALFERV